MELNHKAQIGVLDFFMAFFIFVTLIITSVLIWNQYNIKLNSNLEYNDMMIKAFQISDGLVKNPGSPTNWNTTNVKIIGLATEDRKLSSDKVNKFINISENEVEGIFKTYLYNFSFKLKTIDGDPILSYGDPPAGIMSVSLKRYVLYEDQETIMEFTLWK